MRRHTKWLLPVAVIAGLTLAVGPAATAGSERAAAGTVVFIHDQEPPNLNQGFVGNGLYTTSLVVNNLWLGGQIRDANAKWVLRNFAGKPKLLKRNPLTVSIEFKKNAVWSDGRPVTGADFRATWQVNVDPKNNIITRTGWEDIKSVAASGKKATIVFKRPYASWESLVSAGVYAAHIVNGRSMNEAFADSVPVSSGPWKFSSWQKGVQLTVVRNPRYTAGPRMVLDKLAFRYVVDTNARFQALKAGEGQVMEPQPQLQIAEFQKDSKFKVDQKIGYTFEHLDIQLGAKGHPALRLPYVRQALITGMNRSQIAQALYRDIAPGLPKLDSLIFKPFEPAYAKQFGGYAFDQKKVISILKGKGCNGGPATPSASNSDIFSCPGVGRLSFRFSTTTGNQLRALTFEIIQRQLKSVGIELVPRFQPAGLLFGTTLPSSDWDLIMFGYVQSPESKDSSKDLYACGAGQNYGNYCNRRATRLLERVAVSLDAAERDKILDQVERQFLVKELPSIPLYARPTYVIRANGVQGPVVNPTQEGSPWNVSTWRTAA